MEIDDVCVLCRMNHLYRTTYSTFKHPLLQYSNNKNIYIKFHSNKNSNPWTNIFFISPFRCHILSIFNIQFGFFSVFFIENKITKYPFLIAKHFCSFTFTGISYSFTFYGIQHKKKTKNKIQQHFAKFVLQSKWKSSKVVTNFTVS